MTDEQVGAMVAWYSYICRSELGGDWFTIQSLGFDAETEDMVAGEIGFYHRHGRLPEWAVMIERVDVVDGVLVYVYADRGVLM